MRSPVTRFFGSLLKLKPNGVIFGELSTSSSARRRSITQFIRDLVCFFFEEKKLFYCNFDMSCVHVLLYYNFSSRLKNVFHGLLPYYLKDRIKYNDYDINEIHRIYATKACSQNSLFHLGVNIYNEQSQLFKK